jgi:hypothetical protein
VRPRTRLTFAPLVAAQAARSIEEGAELTALARFSAW